MAVAVVLVAAAIAYVAICARMALVLTEPHRQPFLSSPEQYSLPYESATFPSRVDAIPLDGWLLQPPPGAPRRRPVVAIHGRGSDRTREADGRLLEIAGGLVAAGHPVLLFDLRGSGRSGGQRFTFGVQEVRDVGGAIDFLQLRGLAGDGVDLLGFSMGAATALLMAPDEPLVRAVVADSAYAELASLIDDQVPKASGLPGMFTPGMVFLARPLVGFDMYTIRPIDSVPSMASRGVPLLVIHGDADPTVPVSHGHRIAAAYGEGVETLFVPGAGHVRSYETNPATYLARVIALFDQA
jgi:pimeloyl-ACP methyl ester carboxylesterase